MQLRGKDAKGDDNPKTACFEVKEEARQAALYLSLKQRRDEGMHTELEAAWLYTGEIKI